MHRGTVLLTVHFNQHTALSASSSLLSWHCWICDVQGMAVRKNPGYMAKRKCKKAQIQGLQSVWSRRALWWEPLYTNLGRIVRFFSLLWHMVVDHFSYLTVLLFAAGAGYRLDRYRLCLMWYWDPACIGWWHSAKGLNVPHAGLRSYWLLFVEFGWTNGLFLAQPSPICFLFQEIMIIASFSCIYPTVLPELKSDLFKSHLSLIRQYWAISLLWF